MAGLNILDDAPRARPERPPWLRVRAPGSGRYHQLRQLLDSRRLHTVCASAACPNVGECWAAGTATFMILGNECTRACRFCDVKTSTRPRPVDLDEPARLAEAAALMELEHIVITSVARDDLDDGGAAQFVRCLEAVKVARPGASTEVLVPDFGGDAGCIHRVLDAAPEVFNHNLETVRRLTSQVRSKADYDRTLEVLRIAKAYRPDIKTKSGIMLGLGETDDEVREAMADLRRHDVDILTLGQYLRPSPWHLEVQRYVDPAIFAQLAEEGRALGFTHVESGPLVRSSYHAERAAR
jgi:lipoic acid synthetase